MCVSQFSIHLLEPRKERGPPMLRFVPRFAPTAGTDRTWPPCQCCPGVVTMAGSARSSSHACRLAPPAEEFWVGDSFTFFTIGSF